MMSNVVELPSLKTDILLDFGQSYRLSKNTLVINKCYIIFSFVIDHCVCDPT